MAGTLSHEQKSLIEIIADDMANLSIDNLNDVLKKNNVLSGYDDSKKTLILFVVVFIIYILYIIYFHIFHLLID